MRISYNDRFLLHGCNPFRIPFPTCWKGARFEGVSSRASPIRPCDSSRSLHPAPSLHGARGALPHARSCRAGLQSAGAGAAIATRSGGARSCRGRGSAPSRRGRGSDGNLPCWHAKPHGQRAKRMGGAQSREPRAKRRGRLQSAGRHAKLQGRRAKPQGTRCKAAAQGPCTNFGRFRQKIALYE